MSFNIGDKVLVTEAYENGWWYGNTLKNVDKMGFFPSNYVKTLCKPAPPLTPPEAVVEDEESNRKGV